VNSGSPFDTILVAPRELVDVVFRCGRVAGLDSGSADRVARNVTAAEVGYGGALEAFLDALGEPSRLVPEFVAGPDALAIAEVEARRSGSAEAVFSAPVPVAAVALDVDGVRGRGQGVSGIPDGADGSSTVGRLVVGGGPEPRAVDAGAHAAVARDGIRVDAEAFVGLSRFAHAFLVSEAVLDAADA